MKPLNVFILPGWQDSGPEHWQSLWVATHGYQRVVQHDWMRPLRGDWISRLEEMLLDCDEPALLVAHSLGCQLAAAWAAHSGNTQRVKAALLVAPADPEREALRPVLTSWAPVPLRPLPFPSIVVASRDDSYCSYPRSTQFARAWGAELVDLGPRGHINAESGLGAWPQGLDLLQSLASA